MDSKKAESMEFQNALIDNFMVYAMHVIVSRAIPEIDGFKPSHRKLLYTMYQMGLLDGAKTKSSNIIGATMKLSPYGDNAIYDTLVRMTSGHEALTLPYIESKGNMGKYYSEGIQVSAHRYTEAKLAKVAEELFKGIHKNSVDFVDNYDNRLKEPVLLPVSFPSILVNSNIGIAVGMQSAIPPFNLKEVCNGMILHLQGKDAIQGFSYPDFSTGGQVIKDETVVKTLFEKGEGKFTLRGKYEIVEKDRYILITEIPYLTTVEKIVSEIISAVKSGKLPEVQDVRKETDRTGLKIGIDYKRGVDPQKLIQKILKYTSFEDYFICKIRVLIQKEARVMGIYDLMEEWKKWRISSLRRELLFEKEETEKKILLLEALLKISVNIKKAIDIIQDAKEDEMIEKLMKAFQITKEQAEYVADIKLRNMNRSYIEKRTKDLSALQEKREELKKDIEEETRIVKKIISQLKEVSKKYGADRKTLIVRKDEILPTDDEKEIEKNEKCWYKITEDGYLQKSKEDLGEGSFFSSNRQDEFVFFTDNQQSYKKKSCDIAEGKHFIKNLILLEEQEKVIKTIFLSEEEQRNLVFVYQNGRVSKTSASSYRINRKKIEKAYAPYTLLDVFFEEEGMTLLLFGQKKKIPLKLKDVSVKASRSNQGILAVNGKNAPIISFSTVFDEI